MGGGPVPSPSTVEGVCPDVPGAAIDSATRAGEVSILMDGGVFVAEEAWSVDFLVPCDWIIAVSLDWVRFGLGVRCMLTQVLPFFRFGEADFSKWSMLPGAPLNLFLPALQGSPGVMGEGTSDGGVTIHSSEDDGGETAQSNEVGLGAGRQPGGAFCWARIGPQVSGKEGPTTYS